MILTKYNQLQHGLRVKCQIDGTQIEDAKLSINDSGHVFICQNIIGGNSCNNYLGYQNAYCLSYRDENIEYWDPSITNLVALPELAWQDVYNKLKKAGKPIKFGVDNNANNEGGYNEIYFIIQNKSNLSSWQRDTTHFPSKNGIDYEWSHKWQGNYTGKFYDLGDDAEAIKEVEEGRKIKSIRITLPVDHTYYESLDCSILADGEYYRIETHKMTLIVDPSIVKKIEYEPEKQQLLKRADGSLISEPENKTNVTFIDNDFKLKSTIYGYWLLREIKEGRVFLKEDEHLAEKKAKMFIKQLEIKFEIDRLNAEEGWVDYGCGQPNSFEISESFAGVKYFITMSKKTAQAILAKYSQDELKQYLNIII